MKRVMLLLIVLILCWQAQAWAQKVTVKATIDEGCIRQNGLFTVPVGRFATNLTLLNLSGGTNCRTGSHVDNPAWGISQGDACGTGNVFYYNVKNDGTISQTPGSLSRLRLGPGSYCVHLDGGKLGSVAIAFDLVSSLGPGAWPDFGSLDAGGMPGCLIELSPHTESRGWVLNSRTSYYVWAAPKRVGQPYTAAAWKRYGPWTFADRRRYTYVWEGPTWGGALADNVSATSTELSPALASLGFSNQTDESVWLLVNPLPPGGCPPEVDPRPSRYPHVVIAANGNLVPAPGYDWVSDDPDDVDVIWSPGKLHPQHPNVVAGATEGKWEPAPGYRWVSDDPDDMQVVSTGGRGGWIQTDSWTSKWSDWGRCGIEARVEGREGFATTESSNKCDGAKIHFAHSWTALPETLEPGQAFKLDLAVEDAESVWTIGQGRGYTAVFVGSYSNRVVDLPQDVRIKGMMDYACEQKDTGPLFDGAPLSYVASRTADWGYKDRSSLRPIQAALVGAAFLCRGGGRLSNRVVSVTAPTFASGDKFLVIVVGGHGVRVEDEEGKNTLGAHYTLYVEYSRKK